MQWHYRMDAVIGKAMVAVHIMLARCTRICMVLLCLAWINPAVLAQNTPYSADTLMAALTKAPASLKGTEVTVSGVIAEIKKSQVTFRSSENDKVICELASPADGLMKDRAVGSPLTVVGKVRGRGVLGNVTLDQCSLVVPNVAVKQPSVPAPEPSREPVVAPAAPLETAVVKPPVESKMEPKVEPRVEAPVPAVLPVAKPNPPAVTFQAAAVADLAPREIPPSMESAPCIPLVIDSSETNGTVKDKPNSFGSTYPALHSVLAFLIGGGVALAFVKLRSGKAVPNGARPDDVRRAALESLLKQNSRR